MTHSLDAGHRWLFEHAGILHRDISLDNLMLRGEGDKVYGILNNMDLAVSVGVERVRGTSSGGKASGCIGSGEETLWESLSIYRCGY